MHCQIFIHASYICIYIYIYIYIKMSVYVCTHRYLCTDDIDIWFKIKQEIPYFNSSIIILKSWHLFFGYWFNEAYHTSECWVHSKDKLLLFSAFYAWHYFGIWVSWFFNKQRQLLMRLHPLRNKWQLIMCLHSVMNERQLTYFP